MTQASPENPDSARGGSRLVLIIVAIALLFGLGIGGAFAMGIQVGGGQGGNAAEVPSLAISAEGGTGTSAAEPSTSLAGSGNIPPEALQQLREQGVSEEQIAQIRERAAQFQARQFPDGGQQIFRQGRQGFTPGTAGADPEGSTRIAGTIESIDGNTIVLVTPTGPQRISTIGGTRITITRDGDVSDLAVGDSVSVAALPGPEPNVLEAASISLTPVDE